MQSIIGRALQPNTISRATAAATSLCASGATPTAVPFEASLTGYLPSLTPLAPTCNAKRCLIPTSARRRSIKAPRSLSSIRAESLVDLRIGKRRAQALSKMPAKRHRRYAPARSILDSASTVLCRLVGRLSPPWPAWRGYRPTRLTLDDW